MPVTTALKLSRGWRYVEVMVSNWFIAVFAYPIVFTMVSTGLGMSLTLDALTTAS